MGMVATPGNDLVGWEYIVGDFHLGLSVLSDRYERLKLLDFLSDFSLKIALHDAGGAWTKWQGFPGPLVLFSVDEYRARNFVLQAAYDVHRSILVNEVVVESDYVCEDCMRRKKAGLGGVCACPDCFELNCEAARIVGRVLESKGFKPMYYYSGNKSVHVHLYLDLSMFAELDMFLQKQIMERFKYKTRLTKKFMEWLRERIITCWDVKIREFDTSLIKSTHLIRSEMSRNKAGYKTFIGYTYKDLCSVPYVCNEQNRIYPRIGEVRLSRPYHFQEFVEDFLSDMELSRKVAKIKRKTRCLSGWLPRREEKDLRDCIKLILSDTFLGVGDGYQRAMFILANELKRVRPDTAAEELQDWNVRMGCPVKSEEIVYRLGQKDYSLSCRYVHAFLGSLGVSNIPENCERKIYK